MKYPMSHLRFDNSFIDFIDQHVLKNNNRKIIVNWTESKE